MKQILLPILSVLACLSPLQAQERLIVVNEGTWQGDNGRLSLFEDGKIVSNHWFSDVNGKKLGDTPNDIIQIAPNLIAISVNWSNIIQYIDEEGHDLGATEDIPNNRKLATDGEYLYISSYGHECTTVEGPVEFERGLVAKINTKTFKVLKAIEVGYEPEGIACYKGKLFVANSGGYAFQENHDYEQTVSVIDAATMTIDRTIDTGQINLYGKMSQSGQYLCINSPGDYYEVPAATIILDCDAAIAGKADADCLVKLNVPSTYSTTTLDGNFLAIGSVYSYLTGGYNFNCLTINPAEVIASKGASGVSNTLPGSMATEINAMQMPYGLYVNPYSGYIYATDAAGYAEGGYLYQWTPDGNFVGKYGVYINPSQMLALNPAGAAITEISASTPEAAIYNLQGIRIAAPRRGEIYIRNGKLYKK